MLKGKCRKKNVTTCKRKISSYKPALKIFIHQIDNRPNYSFISFQLCLRSVKSIFFIDQVFEIESCRLGRLLLDRLVGGSVVGWSVCRWLVDSIKPNIFRYFSFLSSWFLLTILGLSYLVFITLCWYLKIGKIKSWLWNNLNDAY